MRPLEQTDDDVSIPADAWVDVEVVEFWRRVRAMSSATYVPPIVAADNGQMAKRLRGQLSPEARVKEQQRADVDNERITRERRIKYNSYKFVAGRTGRRP